MLLLVAIAVTWLRARRGTGGRVSVFTPAGRYALCFDQGRVRLIGPPPAMPADQEAAAWELAGRIRNTDLGWSIPGDLSKPNPAPIETPDAPHGRLFEGFMVKGGVVRYPQPLGYYRADWTKPPIPFEAQRRPLLRAMEDPDRWIVAHYLAWRQAPTTQWPTSVPLKQAGDVYTHDLAGLRIELPVPDLDSPRKPAYSDPRKFFWVYRQDEPPLARIDPSQRTRIRDMWHDRLGVTLVAAPYWLLMLVGLVPPLVWLRGRARVKLRRRRGLCPKCGYDLRASPQCCPECGSTVTATAAASG